MWFTVVNMLLGGASGAASEGEITLRGSNTVRFTCICQNPKSVKPSRTELYRLLDFIFQVCTMCMYCRKYCTSCVCWNNSNDFLSASQACTYEALILKVRIYESVCPRTRVYCHTSDHLTLWTVRNVSLSLSLDTFICQTEIINTIISPMLALYSVNRFKMWLCLFISDPWISERPLICLFHYTLALHCMSMHRTACSLGSGSDVRFVRQQRNVTMSGWGEVSFREFIFCSCLNKREQEKESLSHSKLNVFWFKSWEIFCMSFSELLSWKQTLNYLFLEKK